MIASSAYVDLLDTEYLRTYIASGGAAVKFVVPSSEAEAVMVTDGIESAATAAGFGVVRVDGADVRIHMMDELFFTIARQIDWNGLAQLAVARAFTAVGCPMVSDSRVIDSALSTADAYRVGTVAARYNIDQIELTRDVNRELQSAVYHDYAMTGEFRTAMLRLCQAQLGSGQVSEPEATAVLDWLTGNLRQISLLKSALIFRRIARHSARPMLFSLAHWLKVNGQDGLLITIDIRRLGFSRRPSAAEREGLYYTKAALLDAYELLRQLIDNTDELAGCCVVVVASPEFITDPVRGVDIYQALKLRIFDEVRDQRRDNPFSSLVRVGG